MRNLSGWQRLGVVASVVWVAVAAITFLSSKAVRNQDAYNFAIRLCYDYPLATYEASLKRCMATAPLDQPTATSCRELKAPNLTDCIPAAGAALTKESVWTSGDYEVLASFIIIPIVLLWAIGGALIWTVRWVAGGFRGA